MKTLLRRGLPLWVLLIIGLTATVGWTQPTTAKRERLRIAVAPLGWDTNFTWLQSRSGQLDKRPAL